MDARTSAWSLLICLCLATPLAALTADDYIIPGRLMMFDGPASGLVQACDIFAAGLNDANCTDSAGYRELAFLHALAQTTILFGEPNDIMPTDSLFRLVEEFTVVLAQSRLEDFQAWPDASTTMSAPTPNDDAIIQIDRLVAELGTIADVPTPFAVCLVPEETGLMDDLEVDLADVLMLKGLLLAHRASLEEQRPACPENADAIRARVRQDWADAITCYLDAVDYIALEDTPVGADPQGDELIYLDPDLRSYNDSFTAALVTLRDALQERVPGAGAAGTTRVYVICDANAVRLGELALTFDAAGWSGQEGRLTLADGNSLEVDWLGLLDTGEIGVSMFSADLSTQGWLQGTVTGDHSAITDGVLDLWGACPRAIAPVTARLADTDVERDWSDPDPCLGPSLPALPLDALLHVDELFARAAEAWDAAAVVSAGRWGPAHLSELHRMP
jgi:hypothetical protein